MSTQIYNIGGQIVTPDIYFQIGMGMIPDMESAIVNGYNPVVRNDWETIWTPGGLYPWPKTSEQIELVSDDAEDNLNGNGARSIRITGMDDTRNRLSEVVSMNGLTPVLTTGSYFRVNSIRVVTVGPTGSNEGNIIASHSGVGTIRTIEPLYGADRTCAFSVPNGVVCGCIGFDATLVANGAYAELILLASPMGGPLTMVAEQTMPINEHMIVDFKCPIPFEEETDIELVTKTDVGNKDGIVTATMELFIVDVLYAGPNVGFLV